METAVLGRTNLKVSKIGFGGATMGRHSVSINATYQMIRRALDLGINVFDTSPLYGNGESQRKIGLCLERALKESGVRREAIVLGTKAGHFDNPTPGDFSYETVMRSVRNSLKVLKTPYLDYVLLHDIEFHDSRCQNLEDIFNGGLSALDKLRQEELVKYIGVSGFQLELLSQAIKSGEFDIVLTFGRYTPISTEASTLINTANKLNIGVINAAAFSHGMFFGKDPEEVITNEPWHVDYPNLTKANDLYRLSREHNIPMPHLALRFPIANPKISTTLVGFENIQELRQDLEYAFKPLPGKVNEEMMRIAFG